MQSIIDRWLLFMQRRSRMRIALGRLVGIRSNMYYRRGMLHLARNARAGLES